MDSAAIDAESLRSGTVQVVGDLGYLLGTAVEVEGKIVEVRNPWVLGAEVYDYHFAVEKVNGKALDEVRNFDFWVERELWSLLSRNASGLSRLLEALVDGQAGKDLKITREQADDFRSNYLKLHRKIVVYETARFVGRPKDIPQTRPSTKGPAFNFETFLIIVQPATPFVMPNP